MSAKDITSAIVDYHTHLAGSGTHSGCFIHGDVFSLYHPISGINEFSLSVPDNLQQFSTRCSSVLLELKANFFGTLNMSRSS